jgi:hypothetical protein
LTKVLLAIFLQRIVGLERLYQRGFKRNLGRKYLVVNGEDADSRWLMENLSKDLKGK